MSVAIRCLLIVGVVSAWVGCAAEYEKAGGGARREAASAEKADEEANEPSREKEPATEEAVDGQADAAAEESRPVTSKKPPKQTPPPTETKRAATTAIKLSAGVALPQSLPTGTAMGMSVDYVFQAGDPLPSQAYVWVIEPGKGSQVKQAVQLKRSGTLQAFFTQLRPEHGPFQSHIEDSNGTRLSKSISMR